MKYLCELRFVESVFQQQQSTRNNNSTINRAGDDGIEIVRSPFFHNRFCVFCGFEPQLLIISIEFVQCGSYKFLIDPNIEVLCKQTEVHLMCSYINVRCFGFFQLIYFRFHFRSNLNGARDRARINNSTFKRKIIENLSSIFGRC